MNFVWLILLVAPITTITFVVNTSQATWSNGEFRALPDGGVKMTICGSAPYVDGGTYLSKCVSYEPKNSQIVNQLNNEGVDAWKAQVGP